MKNENTAIPENIIAEQSPLVRVSTEREVIESRIQEAHHFLNSLFLNSTDERYSYLWLRKGKKINRTVPFRVGNENLHLKMAEAAVRYADEGWDVYCGLCTTDTAPDKYHRATKDLITGKTAVWSDLDIQGGNHKKTNLSPDFETVKSFLPIPPSMIINSGYGGHPYWFFDEIQRITDENRQEAEQLNTDFLSIVRHRAGQYSNAVDFVGDLTHILRVPGTFNYKLGTDHPKPVYIVENNGIRYSVSDFRAEVDKLLAEISEKEKKESKPTILLNDLDSNLLEKFSDDEIIERIRNSKQSERFSLLFDEGDISAYNEDDSSADMALMSMLPFWTGGNAAQMERIFDRSALAQRDKWKTRPDYRQMTINNALNFWNGERYKAHSQNKELDEILERSDAGKILATVGNFVNIITYDPQLSDLIAEDKFSNKTIKAIAPPWGTSHDIGKPWTDKDDAQLRFYISQNYGIRSPQLLNDAIIIVSSNNSFHPVRDYLNTLPAWDGTLRAETFFVETLSVEDNAYTRSITLHWLLAAVKRVMVAGCKFDYCLVLAGSQGIGKTTVLEKLGVHWFNNSIDSINGKDALEQLQGSWLIELGEMQATKKADNEAIKNFISRSTDKVRLPYERRGQEFARQCVFSATTNDSEPLKDKTGGRRFWMLKSNATSNSTPQRLAILSDDYIAQVWAEVFQHYNEELAATGNVNLLPPHDILAEAAKLQEEFTEGSEFKAQIENYLEKLIPSPDIWNNLTKYQRRSFIENDTINYNGSDFRGSVRREVVCSAEIAFELFRIDQLNKEKMTLREINTILANLEGWHKSSSSSTRMEPYGVQKNVYVRD